MKKRTIVILAAAVVLVLSLIFQDVLVRTYVRVFHDHLETFAERLLNDPAAGELSYGLWEVDVYPAQQKVEFRTGAWGLAPATTYRGFYYAADNAHKPYQSAQVELTIDGDEATWTDGTDNHGSSVRILDCWFWYKASF